MATRERWKCPDCEATFFVARGRTLKKCPKCDPEKPVSEPDDKPMAGRVRWKCPGCSRSFAIPEGTQPSLCPSCKTDKSESDDIATPGRSGIVGWIGSNQVLVAAAVLGACVLFGAFVVVKKRQPVIEVVNVERPTEPAVLRIEPDDDEVEPVAAVVNDPPQPAPVNVNPPRADPPAAMSLVDVVARVEPSVVRIEIDSRGGNSIGSGFVVDAKGIIVTNFHVIEGARRGRVVFANQTSHAITGVLYADQQKDIAVIRIDPNGRALPVLKVAGSLPRKGQAVVTLGAPRGLSFSVSEGIVSAVRSEAESRAFGMTGAGTWIQTTAPISPGNSGGPLFNMNGEVVGANTFVRTDGQNLNFAISSIDIAGAIRASESRSATPLAQSRPSSPPNGGGRGPQPVAIVDIAGTEEGNRQLAKISTAVIVLSQPSRAVSPAIYQFLADTAAESLQKQGVQIADDIRLGGAAFVMDVELSRDQDAFDVTLNSQLLQPDGKQEKILLLWSHSRELGRFTLNELRSGRSSNYKRVEGRLKGFFRNLETARRSGQE